MVMLEASWLVFQVYKTYDTKSVDDLSLPAMWILLFTNAYWIFTGWIIMRDVPILISGVMYVGTTAALIAAIYTYRDSDAVSSPP